MPGALTALESSGFSPMARRRASKASGKSVSAVARAKAKARSSADAWAERVAALERERDLLQQELERSRLRVRLLEETHAKVRDRIAWALDSLHNILDGKG